MCYNCYADQRNPPRSKEVHNNEEARIQTEFFKLIPLYFPNIPDKLIFAVPNGGSRHIREAANLKRQGVKPGVSDVIVLIPKKGFASLCIEFKTKVGFFIPLRLLGAEAGFLISGCSVDASFFTFPADTL